MPSTPPPDPWSLLDAALHPWALQSKRTAMGTGCTWKGEANGRQIHVVCSMRRRTRYASEDLRYRVYAGHEFVVEVSTPLKTRFTLSSPAGAGIQTFDGWIFKKLQMQHLSSGDAAYTQNRMFAVEAPWAHRLLEHADARTLLCQTFCLQESVSSTLAFAPERLTFRTRRPLADLSPEWVAACVDGLQRLADIAEALPAPEHPVECRTWERYAREHPGRVVGLFFAGFLLFAILFSAVLVLLVVLRLHWLIPLGLIGGWMAFRSFLKKQKAGVAPPHVVGSVSPSSPASAPGRSSPPPLTLKTSLSPPPLPPTPPE